MNKSTRTVFSRNTVKEYSWRRKSALLSPQIADDFDHGSRGEGNDPFKFKISFSLF